VSMRIPTLPTAILLACSAVLPTCVFAGTAPWNLNPTSNDWNTSANWTPNTVPDGVGDVATLGFSNMIFDAGASAYTVTVPTKGGPFIISGAGVINNSGLDQIFRVVP
jgi:hypothetical protein